MTVDTISKAGDVNVNLVQIINSQGVALDITNQILNIEIYEDLFSPFITGNLLVVDSLDISSVLPLVGEERVNLDIETPGLGKIKDQFYLYKMSNKDRFSESAMAYQIHFMSLEGIIDANKKISKAFSGKNSDIVQKLIRSEGLNSKKTANIEETRNSQKYVSNFWSPTQNIAYVMEDSENMTGAPSFVFFENREGYVFASLNSLYAVPPIQTFVEDNYTRTIGASGTTIRSVEEDYKRVNNLYVPDFFDYLDRVQGGYYSSALTSYDVTTKKYTYRVFDAKTKTSKNLNDQALVQLGANYRSDALRLFVPKYYGNFNGYSDVTNANSMQERISLLKQAESLKIQISVAGRVDYTVGRTVNLEVYKNKPTRVGDSVKDLIDPVMSGLYLISAISHQITRKEHICNMELIKDSILKGK